MEIKRAYKFRIYPDAKREKEIAETISVAHQLYNKLLEKTIEAHKKNPSSKISQRTINQFMNGIVREDTRYLKLYAHVRVDIRNRLLRTYQNFFRRCKEKRNGKNQKVGFPRFKSIDRYNSITHIENNGSFHIEKDRLRVSKISGTMRMEMHRVIDGKIKTMTIKREGKEYYAIFTTTNEVALPKVADTNPVGIDMGLTTFATLSDGTKIQKPNFKRNSQKHIAKWQKIVARREKGSHRRQRAKDKLQKGYTYATRQQDDYLNKITNRLVNLGYTSFAVEELSIQNMMKNHHLAKSINDASWNRFIQLLSYKAESAGMGVIKVDARNTSKECSNCGNIKDMSLSERAYNCDRCGMRLDRDINASINILNRATLGQRGSHAQGDNVRLQQEAVVGELRTNPANAGEAHDL
jgi:putative transposase